ncbi:MAG: hydrolase [Verrucomicrobiia bacterium]
MNNPYPSETGCCSRFIPEPWENKELHWDGKLFLKDRVRCFFFVPLNFGKVITRAMEKISNAGAFTPEPPLVLSDHTSRWNMDLYIEVPKEVPDAEHARLSGTFLTKVFEGSFKETGRWCQQMADWVRSNGKELKRELLYYTTCPKCAKHYGKNYVVILAQV